MEGKYLNAIWKELNWLNLLILFEFIFPTFLGIISRYGSEEIMMQSFTSAPTPMIYSTEFISSTLFVDLIGNLMGCFLFGILAGIKSKVSKNANHTHWITIFSTGYCGSYTTFSSWMLYASLLLFSGERKYRGAAIIDSFLTCLLAFAACLMTTTIGVHLAMCFLYITFYYLLQWFSDDVQQFSDREEKFHFVSIPHLLLLTFCLLGIIGSLVFIFVMEEELDIWWIVTAAFLGVAGTWIRWIFSKLNGRFGIKWFPVGTFIVNVIGSWVLAFMWLGMDKGWWGIIVFDGFRLGFCGCLTTVSTFCGEVRALVDPVQGHLWRAYVYSVATFAVSIGGMAVIFAFYKV
eukprot:TRINITY_DN7810_c0_g1_i1.p1 TRINITY_DN7810_c0_g1~~TRINITY_DN7810_c0_g1_i1.p1  ORF type:complete len:347 (+),score=32.36 TRINITY_DN7810_c0_g1_i1:85-1125(+)